MFNFKIVARDRKEKRFRFMYAGNGELTTRVIMCLFFETEEEAINLCKNLDHWNGEGYEFQVRKHA